jgi:large subunit ribosomal protein L24
MEKKFATSWKSSIQVRKQRKYRYNAPLHIKQKMLSVHLSAELRKKHGLRSIQLRKGDKVKILRGQFKKKEGKVDRVNLKQQRVFVVGIETIKKEGSKVPFPLTPSNLMITELELSDKKRKKKLEAGATKKETKETKETKVGKETQAKTTTVKETNTETSTKTSPQKENTKEENNTTK